MAASTRTEKQKRGASGLAIAVALLVLGGWVGWNYYHYFVPPPHASGPLPESKHDWISQVAVKAKGDFSKVDPDMQKKINMFTGGRGADLIKRKYEYAIQ